MAVATNKPQVPADLLLKGLGIDHYFAQVVGGDALPVRKPDPEHLQQTIALAATSAGVDIIESMRWSVMIGDGHNDVLVAHAAGVPCIALSYGYTRTPLEELGPSVIIDRFRDIPAALLTVADERAEVASLLEQIDTLSRENEALSKPA
jgi:phosphoglycolate phosphatase